MPSLQAKPKGAAKYRMKRHLLVDMEADRRAIATTPSPAKKQARKGLKKRPAADTSKSPAKDTAKSPARKDTTKSPARKDTTKSPAAKDTRKSPAAKDTRKSPAAKDTSKSPAVDTTKSPRCEGYHQEPHCEGYHQEPQEGYHQEPDEGYHQEPAEGWIEETGRHQRGHQAHGDAEAPGLGRQERAAGAQHVPVAAGRPTGSWLYRQDTCMQVLIGTCRPRGYMQRVAH